jgi:hypothetical protein
MSICQLVAGVCCGPCNPSKWEADIWGWLEVRRSAMLIYTVNQRPHWAYQQYGHSGGNPGMARCWEMSNLPAGYILQCKVTSASSSGSLGFIVCVKCCRMVDSVPRWLLSLSWPKQSDHLTIAVWMIPPLGREHSHGKTPVHSWKAGPGEVMTVENLLCQIVTSQVH